MTITAMTSASTNIALIKHWGKADESLAVPVTSNLSLTPGETRTATTVSFGGGTGGGDAVTTNGTTPGGAARERVVRFLDLVRSWVGMVIPAGVTSFSTVPLAVDLVSSAAGFAVLAVIAIHATGMRLDERVLFRLIRRGSGSVTCSIFSGPVPWDTGVDDETSYAEPVDCDLTPAMVVVIVSVERETISNTQAMRHTMSTSPLYLVWVGAGREDLRVALGAICARDLPRLGEIVKGNALGVHATMTASRSSVMYWLSEMLDVSHMVRVMRDGGFPVWTTIDAGPNVKVLITGEDTGRVAVVLRDRIPYTTISTRYPGGGIRIGEATT